MKKGMAPVVVHHVLTVCESHIPSSRVNPLAISAVLKWPQSSHISSSAESVPSPAVLW